MIDQKDFLEGAINSLEDTSNELNGLKDALLGSSLEQFRYIFDLNTNKTPIFEELPQIDFGRIAAQSAKQVISSRVREAEKNRQYEDFIEK